ncbi:GNAT family N-acetyltransferase [Paenibacillus sp. G2S3]|uniref:GNAT family N-acetyltransferase n=1 Tax=Paenibacillus sp. G2S3 TaxID=3047872 RepID=UPI0024C1B712|nr:GNAT family N-acetyltransferase [Paenibacillus sp. G2S3]WHY17350.1 GNAT family N-acetyltransferase [Paenibacillus sp. G2S3]
MIIDQRTFTVKGIHYTIRSAITTDAMILSKLRVQIDGETENLDREPGEAFIDEIGFQQLIQSDSEEPRNLFLVAVVEDRIVGFSRCEGNHLKRFSHKVEFGVCVLQDYWGYGIGNNFLTESITWADANGIQKITLNVLETNDKAITLYQKLGFEIEGILKNDKILSDGKFYNTIIMGRFMD